MDGMWTMALALFTLGAVLVFAIWSKTKTEEKLDDPEPLKSTLARKTPDPNFVPDKSVIDPEHVTKQ